MRVMGLDIFPTYVPYVPAIQKWRHDMFPTVIRIHTDDGIDGIGGGGHEHDLASRRRLEEEFSKLQGRDPMKLDLRQVPWPFNVALYDIVGKALDVPVSHLLGSRFRDKAPVAYWTMVAPPEEMAAVAVEAVKKGFTTLKWHASIGTTVANVKAIHDAVGDKLALRIDSPMSRSFSETVAIARQLQGYNIECFEDGLPGRPRNPELYSVLRQKIDIPIAWHAGDDPAEILRGVKYEAADYFNVGSSPQAAAVAQAAGAAIWLSAPGLCTGIQYIFGLHIASTIENASLPADTAFLLEEDFVKEPLPPVVDGLTEVPNRPGLGISPDEDALQKYLTKEP